MLNTLKQKAYLVQFLQVDIFIIIRERCNNQLHVFLDFNGITFAVDQLQNSVLCDDPAQCFEVFIVIFRTHLFRDAHKVFFGRCEKIQPAFDYWREFALRIQTVVKVQLKAQYSKLVLCLTLCYKVFYNSKYAQELV